MGDTWITYKRAWNWSIVLIPRVQFVTRHYINPLSTDRRLYQSSIL